MKDLRGALELLPLTYLLSGTMFYVAEGKLRKLKEQQQAMQLAEASSSSTVERNGGVGSEHRREQK